MPVLMPTATAAWCRSVQRRYQAPSRGSENRLASQIIRRKHPNDEPEGPTFMRCDFPLSWAGGCLRGHWGCRCPSPRCLARSGWGLVPQCRRRYACGRGWTSREKGILPTLSDRVDRGKRSDLGGVVLAEGLHTGYGDQENMREPLDGQSKEDWPCAQRRRGPLARGSQPISHRTSKRSARC
jgi:hypothetical protein